MSSNSKKENSSFCEGNILCPHCRRNIYKFSILSDENIFSNFELFCNKCSMPFDLRDALKRQLLLGHTFPVFALNLIGIPTHFSAKTFDKALVLEFSFKDFDIEERDVEVLYAKSTTIGGYGFGNSCFIQG